MCHLFLKSLKLAETKSAKAKSPPVYGIQKNLLHNMEKFTKILAQHIQSSITTNGIIATYIIRILGISTYVYLIYTYNIRILYVPIVVGAFM